MELDALDGMVDVADSHHLAVPGACGDLQDSGDDRGRERVVPADLDLFREPVEDPVAVVADAACLSVEQRLRLPDLAAVGPDDRLMTETDPERRGRRAEPPD